MKLFKTKKTRENDSKYNKILDGVYDCIGASAFSVSLLVIIFSFFFGLVTVVGHSMDNTLAEEQRLVIRKYNIDPQYKDIVIITRPNYEDPKLSQIPIIKRVIAVAGETVDIKDGKVFIDGAELDEPYAKTETFTSVNPRKTEFPLRVEEGRVFVLGDNRGDSHDSRDKDIGQVDINDILGIVEVRINPMSEFGRVE